MKLFRPRFLALLLLALVGVSACEKTVPVLETVTDALNRDIGGEAEELQVLDIPPPPEPVATEPVVNKDARVSILGYHDFSEGHSTNDMILNIEDFRRQMQAIRDAGLPVISMREFLDWKNGKAPIPPESMMITIDDGWKATHTLAMEVLREFGYPYTIFLYQNYVGVGGRSLTHEEIRELAANGATISSHSVSHQNLSRRAGRSEAAHRNWLKEELEDSYQFLEENFGDTGAVLKTFAYPYGIYSELVVELATEFGYEACFTVNGKKTVWDDPDMEIGRYVVHGTTLANFEPALNFGGDNVTSLGRRLVTETTTEDGETDAPLVEVRPPPGSIVGNRLPLIEADLSRLEGVQPETISMRVTGFTRVPHVFDPVSGILSYQVPQRLRLDQIGVQVSFRHAGNSDTEVIAWDFKIDRLADYLSSDATQEGKNDPLDGSGNGTAAAEKSRDFHNTTTREDDSAPTASTAP